jgi:hypothetical protein
VTDLAYVDVRPVLAKVADLGRELVLVGGQAVNFWASYYEHRAQELAREAPFTSKDIDFCGDQRAVRVARNASGERRTSRRSTTQRRTAERWSSSTGLASSGRSTS